MKRKVIDTQTVVLGITIGAFVAVATFLLLIVLARPQDLRPRVATLDSEINRAEHLSKAPGNPYAFGAGTICSSPSAGADELTRRADAAAAASSVALSNIAIYPPALDSSAVRVAPITLQFTATGKYEAVVAMLAFLAKGTPEIFADTADLRPTSGGGVSFKFSGKVLCWTSAHR